MMTVLRYLAGKIRDVYACACALCVRRCVCGCVGQFSCVCVLVCVLACPSVCVRDLCARAMCEACAFAFERDSVRLFMRASRCVGVRRCGYLCRGHMCVDSVCARSRAMAARQGNLLFVWMVPPAGARTTIAYQGQASIRRGKGAEV